MGLEDVRDSDMIDIWREMGDKPASILPTPLVLRVPVAHLDQ